MKSLLERITWVKIVEGALLIILGILIGVLGGLYAEQIGNGLAICVAVFLFIDGLLTLAGFLLDPKSNFSLTTVIGCLFITIGVLLCINTTGDGIGTLIGMFVAILLLTSGVVYLIKGCIQISIKAPVGWIIINFLIAVLGIVLGIVSIIYYKDYLKVVFVVIGVAVAILGTIDLVFAIIKYRNKLKEAPVNAKVGDVVENDTPVDQGEVKEITTKDKKTKKDKKARKLLGHKKPKQLTNSEDSSFEETKPEESNENTNAEEKPAEENVNEDFENKTDESEENKDSEKVIDAEVK